MAPRPSSARISYRPKRSLLRSSISEFAAFRVSLQRLNVREFSRSLPRRMEILACASGRRREQRLFHCVLLLRAAPSYRRVTAGKRPGPGKGNKREKCGPGNGAAFFWFVQSKQVNDERAYHSLRPHLVPH